MLRIYRIMRTRTLRQTSAVGDSSAIKLKCRGLCASARNTLADEFFSNGCGRETRRCEIAEVGIMRRGLDGLPRDRRIVHGMQHPENAARLERRFEQRKLSEVGCVGHAENDRVVFTSRGPANPEFTDALLQFRHQA